MRLKGPRHATCASPVSRTTHLEQRGAEALDELGGGEERGGLGRLDADVLGLGDGHVQPLQRDAREVERADGPARPVRRQRRRELGDDRPVVDLVLDHARLRDGDGREELPLDRVERDARLAQVLVEQARAQARDDLAREEHLARLDRLGPEARSEVQRRLERAHVDGARVEAPGAPLRPSALQRRGDLEEDRPVVELVLQRRRKGTRGSTTGKKTRRLPLQHTWARRSSGAPMSATTRPDASLSAASSAAQSPPMSAPRTRRTSCAVASNCSASAVTAPRRDAYSTAHESAAVSVPERSRCPVSPVGAPRATACVRWTMMLRLLSSSCSTAISRCARAETPSTATSKCREEPSPRSRTPGHVPRTPGSAAAAGAATVASPSAGAGTAASAPPAAAVDEMR